MGKHDETGPNTRPLADGYRAGGRFASANVRVVDIDTRLAEARAAVDAIDTETERAATVPAGFTDAEIEALAESVSELGTGPVYAASVSAAIDAAIHRANNRETVRANRREFADRDPYRAGDRARARGEK